MQATLTVKARNQFGKEKAHKLRAAGVVPAVIYGAGQEVEHVLASFHDITVLAQHIHGQTILVDVKVEDEAGKSRDEKVFVRELQRDPVTERIIHADLLRVDMNKPVTLEIPIVSTGIPAGVKLGGLLETLARSVTVRCLPGNVLPKIEVDISEINIGSSLHAGEVKWPEGIEILSPPETALYTVLGRREEEEVAPAAAAAEAPAEPELIGRKKKEEEGEGEEGGAEAAPKEKAAAPKEKAAGKEKKEKK